MQHIAHDRLRELIEYNPETGAMVWLKPTSNRVKTGARAGSLGGNGYWQIKLDGVVYNYHRIAWFYAKGVWPDRWIDHKNGDITDNRLENLRLSTISQNAGNSKIRSNNTVGFKGVERKRGKFSARIKCGGYRLNLGVFKKAEEAHEAYIEAAKRLFGEFARAA